MGILSPQELSLDFNKNEVKIVGINQYDENSRSVKITCTENGVPVLLNSETHTAQLKLMTSKNHMFLNRDCCEIQGDGTILVTFEKSMMYDAGKAAAQVLITTNSENAELLSTVQFGVVVRDSVFDDEEYIKDYDQYSELSELLVELKEAVAHVDIYTALAESWAIGGTGVRPGEDTDNAKYYAQQAESSKDAAAASATNANTSATSASTSATNASTSATSAHTSEVNAKTSEDNAKDSETNAKTSKDNAKDSEINAKTSEDNAKDSETNAHTSEVNAATSEINAATSETNAENSATLSESWAIGHTNTRTGEDTNNSKYWSEKSYDYSNDAHGWCDNKGDSNINTYGAENNAYYYAKRAAEISDSIGGNITPMGSIYFADLPAPVTSGIGKNIGYLYNIIDGFTTTSDFVEGAGIEVAPGAEVFITAAGKYSIKPTSGVSGVKGNAETDYRTGLVNISPINIGISMRVSGTNLILDTEGN